MNKHQKETPMEPVNKDFEFVSSSCGASVIWGDCPKCEHTVLEMHNYCWNCGQKIDWKDTK